MRMRCCASETSMSDGEDASGEASDPAGSSGSAGQGNAKKGGRNGGKGTPGHPVIVKVDVGGGASAGRQREVNGSGGASDGDEDVDSRSRRLPDPSLRLIHFNDVYNINNEEGKPGGAARFATVLRERMAAGVDGDDDCGALVLCSGDVFSPSLEGNCCKGAHMVPVMRRLNVHASCVGNHDLDYGEPRLRELIDECGFPWLMANVRFKHDGSLLAGSRESVVIAHGGRRIGVMGLVECEWFDTLNMVDEDSLVFEDFVTKGREIARRMRDEERCDLVVALTHMRLPNDERLAMEVQEIDLVLGGHDHSYHVAQYDDHGMIGDERGAGGGSGRQGNWVVKSGTDFKDFTEIKIAFGGAGADGEKSRRHNRQDGKRGAPDGKRPSPAQAAGSTKQAGGFSLSHRRYEITGSHSALRDPVIAKIIDRYSSEVEASLEEVIGMTETALDCRFKQIRSSETALGSFFCDVIRENCEADVVILNSGTFRSDLVHGPGEIKQRDLTLILPFMQDVIVLLEMTGSQVIDALENGVSMYPRLEGRFPQVSGISFAFDPNMEAGSRVLQSSVMMTTSRGKGEDGGVHPTGHKVAHQAGGSERLIDLEKTYKVATKSFLASGRDGYTVFPQAKTVVDHEDGWVLPTLIRNFFVDSKTAAPVPISPTPRQRWDRAAHQTSMKRKSLCLSPSELLDHLNNKGLCRVAGGLVVISPRLGQRIRLSSMMPTVNEPSSKGYQ